MEKQSTFHIEILNWQDCCRIH